MTIRRSAVLTTACFCRLAYTKFKNLPMYLEWAPVDALKKVLRYGHGASLPFRCLLTPVGRFFCRARSPPGVWNWPDLLRRTEE